MNKIKLFSLSLVALFMACFTACENKYDVDHTAHIVGTWTYIGPNYAEALVIKEDGSVLSTGVEDGEYWENVAGTIKIKDNVATMTFEDGDDAIGHIDVIPGIAFSIYEEDGEEWTFNYCANDLSDEIVGMWVCNDGPMAGDDDMTIQTFNADGTSILTGVGPSGDKGGQITYKVVGDLLFNIMPKQLADGVSRYTCSRIVYSPNGTALGDVMSHTSYYAVGENFDIVKSTVTWLRVKQSLDLACQKYDYKNVYVSNVKGEDKDIPFFDTTINFAKWDNSLMNNFLSATLFSVEFPDANTMKYSFLLANNITTYPPTSIEVEGNKMTIKMSANNSVYKDVELYAFQDKDNSQLHMYMPTKSFENFFGNMQVNIMVEKGQLDLTDADAVKAVFDNIESAVETINVSLVFKAK